MRKFFAILVMSSALVACGGSDTPSKTEEKKSGTDTKTETTSGGVDTNDPAYQKGLTLEAQNDCKTCHSIDVKVTGPSFQDISGKYGSDKSDTIVAHLARKIISGGTGVWGSIPMTPHAGLSQEDAEAIVRYILLFKK